MKGLGRLMFCLLTACCMVVPVSAISIPREYTCSGTWLYVGGSGPGNYTTIQDALNESVKGDTIFIYDDVGPYDEILFVNTSVTMLGENAATTILNASGFGDYMITVNAPQVTIKNLTLECRYCHGIKIQDDETTVTKLIIRGTDLYAQSYGIFVYPTGSSTMPLSHTVIEHSTFLHLEYAVYSTFVTQSIVDNNTFLDCVNGVALCGTFKTTVADNLVRDNDYGIVEYLAGKNHISGNLIMNNTYGVECCCSTNSIIEKNTFLNNTNQAHFSKYAWLVLIVMTDGLRIHEWYFLQHYRPFRRTIWRQNYWNESRVLPYIIQGVSWHDPYNESDDTPRIQIDWHPAQTPYPTPKSLLLQTQRDD
jgi:parallel beta-helix repeat protein